MPLRWLSISRSHFPHCANWPAAPPDCLTLPTRGYSAGTTVYGVSQFRQRLLIIIQFIDIAIIWAFARGGHYFSRANILFADERIAQPARAIQPQSLRGRGRQPGRAQIIRHAELLLLRVSIRNLLYRPGALLFG